MTGVGSLTYFSQQCPSVLQYFRVAVQQLVLLASLWRSSVPHCEVVLLLELINKTQRTVSLNYCCRPRIGIF